MAGTSEDVSRREFLRGAAALASVAAVAGSIPQVYAAGSDTLRVGVVGCGGRGTGAAMDCLRAVGNVKITALGDLFADRLEQCKAALAVEEFAGKVDVTPDTCFVGFDAYEKVLRCDIDVVILATPPNFRPEHLRAAVSAGKHIFMEKPVAVDPVGIRSVIESSEMAGRKGLSIVAGTQRRHQKHYIEAMERIRDGAIGELVAAQCYWNMGTLWLQERQPLWTDMEYQIRNWLYYTWLSGDHIVEQHVHNLDIVNWAMGSTPVKAYGLGGRQVRTQPEYGDVFDHFAVEYEYPNGARMLSMCRQTAGCSDRISERIVGSKGVAYLDMSRAMINKAGSEPHELGDSPNPYEVEHADLAAAIRSNSPVNEGKRVAESTLTAIMGRMSAYTGREISWRWVLNSSKLDLGLPRYEFGDMPSPEVAIPGQTPLV